MTTPIAEAATLAASQVAAAAASSTTMQVTAAATSTNEIVVGVVAGLMTSAALLVLRSLFQNSFLPWYRHVMYSGLRINGEWHQITYSQEILLELSQRNEKLSGKATVVDRGREVDDDDIDHVDEIRTFDVEGEINQRFVMLIYRHSDRSRLGVCSSLLQVEGDGTVMRGQESWYAPTVSRIECGSVELFRNRHHADAAAEAQEIAYEAVTKTKAKPEANAKNEVHKPPHG